MNAPPRPTTWRKVSAYFILAAALPFFALFVFSMAIAVAGFIVQVAIPGLLSLAAFFVLLLVLASLQWLVTGRWPAWFRFRAEMI